MRIFIPPELRGLARQLAVQSWVDGRQWPRERYFKMIDACRVALSTLGDDAMDNPAAIADVLSAVLRVDERYMDYIMDKRKVNMGDGDEWREKCLAAAWAIIQRYNREEEKGLWQADL